MRARALVTALVVAVLAAACGSSGPTLPPASPSDAPTSNAAPAITSVTSASASTTSVATFRITSSAFADDAAIPKQYTCQGASTSPPLSWSGVPSGAAQLALVVIDPDAPGGSFVHWTMWGIAPAPASIDAGVVPAGAVQGRNGAGRTGYTGPCPPSGTHHYHFQLFALRAAPTATATSAPAVAVAAIERAATARTELVGTYTRG
jgi:Raf kinase inhibitor-like YbhB/YbcL family protein